MNKLTQFIKEINQRWHAESPEFWKVIKKYSIIFGTSAFSIIGLDKMIDLQSYGVPTVIFTVCGYILTFCAATGLTAQITKKDGDNTDK